MTFIHDDFMLENETAKRLYHEYAKDMPIFDYHCHISPQLIAEDYAFEDIGEIWLAGDHYKWRAMRANGVPERLITGDSTNKEKFEAWAATVPNTVGNPLYHWSAMELKTYFGVDELLNEDNWESIYEQANAKIKDEKLTARKLIEMSNVHLVGTTDNPDDSLEYHVALKDSDFGPKVVPSFRPDAALDVASDRFRKFIKDIGVVVGETVDSYAALVSALAKRIDFFDELGTVASDHALETIDYIEKDDTYIEAVFQKAVDNDTLTKEEKTAYQSRLLYDLAGFYTEKNWVMQIHFGALRNNNSKYFDLLGYDTGFDSIRDTANDAFGLNRLLDAFSANERLPKMILYPLNPNQFDTIASTIANFQVNDQGVKSKIQLGSGWWFNDTERGMIHQMEALADHGLLMHFVGMLTDSRSFVSYPRHDYFRRILCQLIGEKVEKGKIPNDEKLLKQLIENISFNNAVRYFQK